MRQWPRATASCRADRALRNPLTEGEVDLEAVKPRTSTSAGGRAEIASAQLAGLVAERRTEVFAGSLADIPLPTVLSMLEGARKSGRLALARGRVTATVDLVDGRVVDAQWSELPASPREILISMLDWTDGTFELFAANLPPRDLDSTYTLAEICSSARASTTRPAPAPLRADAAHEWMD